ncbi:MAG: hypothetical protein ACPG19_06430 [Saprospiraceae bacterium]
MKLFLVLFSTVLFFSCNQSQKVNDKSTLDISTIDLPFPLKLEEINLLSEETFHVNDAILSEISQTIIDFKETTSLDSLHLFTNKDIYINTIRLYDERYTVFLVLLKYYPSSVLYSKALFYDNEKKEFINDAFEFKIYAMYDNYENGKLTPSNLKTLFKINTPEIDLIDYNNDGINDYKFVRLWHNGTANALHTTIITIQNGQIDTLHFEEKWY